MEREKGEEKEEERKSGQLVQLVSFLPSLDPLPVAPRKPNDRFKGRTDLRISHRIAPFGREVR